LSKRAKRKIHEVCGLNDLSREAKIRRASEILADSDLKQSICNQVVGTSHRDIEKVLKAIVTTKLSDEDELNAELEREQPEKLHPETKSSRKVQPIRMVAITNQKEITWLINASNEPLEQDDPKPILDRPSYSQEEINALLNSSYDPADFDR